MDVMNMKRIRKYNFVISPLFLGVFLILYYISALYIPFENNERWIPALIGFFEVDTLSGTASTVLATIFILATAVTLYFFNERNLMIGQSGLMLPVIYLIFAVTSPNTLSFSGVSVASLFVAWSLYYSLFTRDGEKELFTSGFLISIAALFDPHITLLIPLIIFFSLRSAIFSARAVIIVLGSILIPFIFMFSVRYLFFEDALFFGEIYLTDLKSITYPSLGLKNVSEIVVTLSLFIYLCFTISYVASNINRYKILKSKSFSRFIATIIFTSLIVIFYPQSGEGLTQVIAIPGSVLVSEYISQKEKPTRKRIGFLLILIFLTMSRIASFI